MPTRLTPEDRTWFRQLADLIYGNPFNQDPQQVRHRFPEDCQGVGQQRHPFGLLVPALHRRLDRLDRGGPLALGDLAPEDQPLLRLAWLFDGYDQVLAPLDRLIEQQEASPEQAPSATPLAREAFARLIRRGFSEQDTQRYFGLYYQLRRAFHFIHRNLVGTSPCMRTLRMQLWDSLFTRDARDYDRYLWNRMEDFATLLLGETGTGKGSAAAAIGRAAFIPYDPTQGRFSESFMRGFTGINLNEFPESLVESELFGHRKGAFTGAVKDYTGLLGRCSAHGALFLDEIGEIGVPLQIKLLRVLQERVFSPVGSREQSRFSGRLIAATNQDLDRLRADGRFREDFYFRLSSQVIQVPPLRQRLREDPSELAGLTASLLNRIVGEPDDRLLDRVLRRLQGPALTHHPWPGNVRELEQAIRRILLTGDYAPNSPKLAGTPNPIADEPTLRHLSARYCALLYRRYGSYEEVSRRAGLDRRTARKYVLEGMEETDHRKDDAT